MGDAIDFKTRKPFSDGNRSRASKKKLADLDLSIRSAVKNLDAKAISRFQKEFKALRKQVGSKGRDYRSDVMAQSMLRAQLAMVLDLLPTAEKQYKMQRNEQAAYALLALVNSARDISSDIRNFTDFESQADYISSTIVNPMLILCTQQMITMTEKVKTDLEALKMSSKDMKKAKESLDTSLRDMAKYMEMAGTASAEKIKKYLMGEAEGPSTGGKRRKSGGKVRH
jgi:hypothetical protein